MVKNGLITQDQKDAMWASVKKDVEQNIIAEKREKQASTMRTGYSKYACESCKYGAGRKCYFRSYGNPGYDSSRGSEVIKIEKPSYTTCDCYKWDHITVLPPD